MTFIKFHEVLSKGSERPEEILKRRDRSLIICLSISNERKTQFFSPWPLILTFLEELSSLPAQDSSQTHNNITREMRKGIISGYTTFFGPVRMGYLRRKKLLCFNIFPKIHLITTNSKGTHRHSKEKKYAI